MAYHRFYKAQCLVVFLSKILPSLCESYLRERLQLRLRGNFASAKGR